MNKDEQIKELLQVILFEALKYNGFNPNYQRLQAYEYPKEPLNAELCKAIDELVAYIKLEY